MGETNDSIVRLLLIVADIWIFLLSRKPMRADEEMGEKEVNLSFISIEIFDKILRVKLILIVFSIFVC